jgi:hypothetical protein
LARFSKDPLRWPNGWEGKARLRRFQPVGFWLVKERRAFDTFQKHTTAAKNLPYFSGSLAAATTKVANPWLFLCLFPGYEAE